MPARPDNLRRSKSCTQKRLLTTGERPRGVYLCGVIVCCVTPPPPRRPRRRREATLRSPGRRVNAIPLTQSAAGRLLAEGENSNAAGPYSITAYRVEELQLPRSVKPKVGGREVESDTAWRITLTGDSFPVRAMPPALFIDGVLVGYGVETSDLTAITFVTLDRSLLREGATLAFAYGNTRVGRVELSEKLKLN